ncbi:MAG: hypothetical protein IPL03_12510 [Sterolibacteriaceae bacterium]|nr:hypothetical protein [Candidatus Methylophosphatis haderslevensis]
MRLTPYVSNNDVQILTVRPFKNLERQGVFTGSQQKSRNQAPHRPATHSGARKADLLAGGLANSNALGSPPICHACLLAGNSCCETTVVEHPYGNATHCDGRKQVRHSAGSDNRLSSFLRNRPNVVAEASSARPKAAPTDRSGTRRRRSTARRQRTGCGRNSSPLHCTANDLASIPRNGCSTVKTTDDSLTGLTTQVLPTLVAKKAAQAERICASALGRQLERQSHANAHGAGPAPSR